MGGGLTGISAAYHLARHNARPVVFEAGCLGDGASGRTGGLVLEGTAKGVLEGVDDCVATVERVVRVEEIDCELELRGCWQIEHREGDGVAGGRRLPWNDDGRAVRVASTVAGGAVDPMKLLFGLARAAVRSGAAVCERAAVGRLVVKPELRLELGGTTVRPGYVVFAVNAWMSLLLRTVRAVNSALTYACATEPLDAVTLAALGLGARMPFFTIDLPYLWGRVLKDGRVIFGSGLVFRPPGEIERVAIDADESRDVLARLTARVRALNPALGEVGFSALWAGPIGIPGDLLPLAGRLPEAPAVLVAGGYSGHGVALSVRLGKLLADAIVEQRALPAWGAPTP